MENHPTGDYELGVIKMFHDDAYGVIDRALSLEENQQSKEALDLYENGIRLLEQGLSLRCDRPEHIGDSWDKSRLLQMKMRKTREDVLGRLSTLMKQRPDVTSVCADEAMISTEMPPSYEEACYPSLTDSAAGSSGRSRFTNPDPVNTKKDLHDVCQKLPSTGFSGTERFKTVPPEAQPIFNIANGVQIFFISANGDVSAPSYPTALIIYTIKHSSTSETTNINVPPAFLQVGEWVYPLIPGQMPVLHTTYGAYMLPDVNSVTPGAAIGLIMTDIVIQQDRKIFEHLMCELTALKTEIVESREPSERRMSTKISDGLVTGAEMLSKGMVYGAEKTSEYIKLAANKWRNNMEPVHSPTYVDPNVQKGLQIARDVSKVAVRVSGYLINQLGRATVALGHQLAPHVRKHGASLFAKAFGEEEQQKADQTMNNVIEVAAGGLKGFSTVYLGLQESAKILANNLISETVTTVNYKYGADAASTTDDGLRTIGNVTYAAYNINHLGIKAIAKKTATETGKAIILQKSNEKLDVGNIGGKI